MVYQATSCSITSLYFPSYPKKALTNLCKLLSQQYDILFVCFAVGFAFPVLIAELDAVESVLENGVGIGTETLGQTYHGGTGPALRETVVLSVVQGVGEGIGLSGAVAEFSSGDHVNVARADI